MRFEKEINLFKKNAILKRFKANETAISVVQGKISALISESELTELTNSKATLYSKMANATLKIDSLQLDFSDLYSKYDAVTGKYDDLNSKVANYKASVDGLSANVTAVQKNLANNYSTTSQMNAAIEAKIGEVNLSVSNMYAAKAALNEEASKIASLEAWQKEASVKITDSAIVSTVRKSSPYTSDLAGKVGTDEIISKINQTAEKVTISAAKINFNGLVTANNYFRINTDGSFIAKKRNNRRLDG